MEEFGFQWLARRSLHAQGHKKLSTTFKNDVSENKYKEKEEECALAILRYGQLGVTHSVLLLFIRSFV
jgi:hypothetical protein